MARTLESSLSSFPPVSLLLLVLLTMPSQAPRYLTEIRLASDHYSLLSSLTPLGAIYS